MDAFRKLLVTNREVDTSLPYFVGVSSLDNHSINIILHVRRPPRLPGPRDDEATLPALEEASPPGLSAPA